MQLAVNFLEPNSRTLNFEFSPSFFFFLFPHPHSVLLYRCIETCSLSTSTLYYYSPFCRVFVEISLPCEYYTLKKKIIIIKSGVPTFNNSYINIYTRIKYVSPLRTQYTISVHVDQSNNKDENKILQNFIEGWRRRADWHIILQY